MMPIGDDSPFSDIDAALWTALKDTVSTQGSNLDAWRKEQSASGNHGGTNFESGELPPPDKWKTSDFPALFLNSGGLLEVEDPQPDGGGLEVFTYPVEIVGAIKASREHHDTMKKLRRFAHLTMQLLILKGRTCFDIASTTVQFFRFNGLTLVPLIESEDDIVPAFVIGLELEVRLAITY